RSALSTRSGVRTRPSRRGSSPMLANNSLTRGAMLPSPCFACITFTTALLDFIGLDFKDVPRGFRDANLFQLRPLAGEHGAPLQLHAPADLESQVLRGRNDL